MSGGKQTEPSFPLGFCLHLAPFCFFLSWKTSQSKAITSIPITWCNHHYALKYGEWYSVMCSIGFVPNIALCIQDKKVIAWPHFFAAFTLLPCCKEDACFLFFFCTGFLLFVLSIKLVLWSKYSVVDPTHCLLSPPLNSVLKSPLSSWWNPLFSLRQLSQEGRMCLCRYRVYWYTIQSLINNFTMLKGTFNIWKPPLYLWVNLCPCNLLCNLISTFFTELF